MRIRDIFSNPPKERIEPVVKVGDRKPEVVRTELASLIVTDQWERYVHQILDAYVDAATREHEQGVGIWISGFFGSGKSLLMKTVGVLLEGGMLAGDSGDSIHETFLNRVRVGSPDRSDIKRFLAICNRQILTATVGGNLHSKLTSDNERLPLIVFRLFGEKQGYTHNWPLAWAVEYRIDEEGKSQEFRQRVAEATSEEWEEVRIDPEVYLDDLYQAAAETLPRLFANANAVEKAANAVNSSGVDDARLIERFRRWCEVRDEGNKRQKLLIQLDELGQWIASGNDTTGRIMQVQALVEQAAEQGGGRIWLAVTAHGDVQSVRANVQQEHYAKIIQRFGIQCKLSNEDINQVVRERVLRKSQEGRVELAARFSERAGLLTDLGQLEQTQRTYTSPDEQSFPLSYPYLPWTVAVVPDVVKGIAQAANRDEALTGSNRTMIAVVQGALLDSAQLLDSAIGPLLSLAGLYPQLMSDVPVEIKTDLNRIKESIGDEATDFTVQVARGLFLLGQADYIATTIKNVARTVVAHIDTDFAALCRDTERELNRLIAARYAKQVGNLYTFLNTQQRTFQERVWSEEEQLRNESYKLSQKLREAYGSENALRIERPRMAGREINLRLDLDGTNLRNRDARVTIQVLSPFQRTMDPQIGNNTAMRQRSAEDPNTIYLRMADVAGLRQALARALATQTIANDIASRAQSDNSAKEVARRAMSDDYPEYQTTVRRLLGEAMRDGEIFYGGIVYQIDSGTRGGEGVLSTLSQILPNIYPRFHELPHRLSNEASAVRAALSQNSTQSDVAAMGLFRKDGTVNDSHPLLSNLRARLPLADQDQEPIKAEELRAEFERPPYGWDGNSVKVGLALLLYAAHCRLIVNGEYINDPSDARAAEFLGRDVKFRQVRVQGISADLTPPELIPIRQQMADILGTKKNVPVVPATLANTLGDALQALSQHIATLRDWAATAQCPLPPTLETGQSVIEEILNHASEARRLRYFAEQASTVNQAVQTLNDVQEFRHKQAARFQEIHNFYTSMVHVSVDLAALNNFVRDFATLQRERSMTEPARWQEIAQSYGTAQAALNDQTRQWQQELAAQLTGLNVAITEAVRQSGVPDDQVSNEAAAIAELFNTIRNKLDKGKLDFAKTRALRTEMSNATVEKERLMRELNTRYRTELPDGVTHLTWSELTGGAVHLNSHDQLDDLLDEMRKRLHGYIEDGKKIVIG